MEDKEQEDAGEAEEQEEEPGKEEAEQEIKINPVFCKHCQKKVIPLFKDGRWRCPDCNLYVKSLTPKSVVKEDITKKDVKLSSQRNINLGGQELATAEVLINAGLAENFNDLVRKGIEVMYRSSRLPFGQQLKNQEDKMEKDEPNPQRTRKELQEDLMLKAWADQMKGNPMDSLKELQQQRLLDSYIKSMNTGNQTDPLQMMMVMRMMDNQGNQGKGKEKENGFMDKLLEIQMFKSITGGNQDNSWQREIADLKNTIAMNQVLQAAQQKNSPSLQDQMLALEKIRAERDVSVKAAEMNAQSQRDLTLKTIMESKMAELARGIEEAKQGGGGIDDLVDKMVAVKKVSEMMAGGKEKGTGEMILEGLGKIAPPLIELGKQRMQQMGQQMMMQQNPPAQNPPMQNQEFPQEPEQFPEQQFPPQPEMSLQQQMDETMTDMYIRKKK